jgi:hypothetical protein
MPLCGLQGGRRNYKHLALAALIFIGASTAYSKYRASMMGDLGGYGAQLFYNFYVNSSEFGVKLSSDLGPHTKIIMERVRRCLLPSPSESPHTKILAGPQDFMENYFYKYTADELVEKIATQSNRTYYDFILDAMCVATEPAALDRVLLGASLEIARAHPLYVLRLFLRNSFQLLYDPGWGHSEFDVRPENPDGLVFPLGDSLVLVGGTMRDNRLPQPAASEAEFVPLARQSGFIRELYFVVYNAWYRYYHPVTIVVGCLAWFTWISTVIGLLQRTIGGPTLARWSRLWLSDRVIPASVGISVILLANVAITAVAVDPIYGYDFSLQTLKIMLGGIGLAIVLEFVSRIVPLLLRPVRVSGETTRRASAVSGRG